MESKLTLKLSKEVITQAKSYARDRNISLSKLIENYLQTVIEKKKEKSPITPLVQSLTGVIEINEKDNRKDYTDFLSNKYS
jgi:hypothetical protein